MESPTRKSRSKIEMKIIKNTFSSNSNDLQFKDNTRKSFQTFTSKASFSIIPKTANLSDISRVSSNPTERIRLFSVQDLDLSTFSFQITPSSLDSLQDLIKVSVPGSTITLPPKRLSFTSLHITSPILIKGMPGTVIEVLSGSITVDFSSQSKDSCLVMEKAIICEVAIEFKPNDLPGPGARALIVIDSNSTHLEVRDCDIRSFSKPESEDTAFMINGNGYRRGPRGFGRFNSSLSVCSCNFQGFFEVCRAGINASITYDRCFITGCKGNAFSVMNPRECVIKNSVLDKTEKNAVDILVHNENSANLNSPVSKTDTVNSLQGERLINIEGNDIRASGNYGINIWSESLCSSSIVCLIKLNKITNSKKEGVAIRHLNISTLELDSNDSNCNQGTGYWLQKVSTGKLLICNNRAFDNYSGYGLYVYDTGGYIKNNEFFRNSLGGIMIVGASKGTNTNLVIKKSQAYNNGENGITVMDVCKGNIEISKCKINENLHDGIHLLQTRELGEGEKGFSAVVRISDCQIVRNSFFGVNIIKFRCVIERLELFDNEQGSIQVAEDTKGLVKFINECQSVEVKSVKKKGICSRNKCSVF